MSDFDSLREDVAAMSESFAHYHTAVNRNTETLGRELNKLWDDNAAIRDDLHAVANRLEALTAFVTNPAEVAAKIVNDANRATAYHTPVTDIRGNVRPERLSDDD